MTSDCRARKNYRKDSTIKSQCHLIISSRRTRNSQFIEKHDKFSHIFFQCKSTITIHAKKPTES